MNNMKFNMIFAALLCAGIIAMLAGFTARSLSHPAKLHEDAVKVEAAEASTGGAPKVAMPEPILGLIAAADAERGKAVAKACAACHNFEQGGPNGVGPNLYGIVGREKESHAGFAYSGSLKKQGGDTWTYLELNKFIWKPKGYDPETKMSFIGLKKAEDRTALIAYLRTLGNHPVPTQGEIDAEAKELAPPAEATPAVAAPADAAAPAKDAPKAH